MGGCGGHNDLSSALLISVATSFSLAFKSSTSISRGPYYVPGPSSNTLSDKEVMTAPPAPGPRSPAGAPAQKPDGGQ